MIATMEEAFEPLFDFFTWLVFAAVNHFGFWGALILLGLLPVHVYALIIYVKRTSIRKSRMAKWSLLPVLLMSLVLSFFIFGASLAWYTWRIQ